MRESLVIAVTRMGDLIQTEPFCRALKQRRGGRVVLLVEEAFVPVAERLQGVDEIAVLRFRDILPSFAKSARDFPIAHLNRLIQSLNGRKFEEVWNLTHTRPAMMLAAMIGGECARGVSLDSRGLQTVRNDWLKYFFATNLARPWSPYNLIDVYVNAVDEKTAFDARIPRLRGASYHRRTAQNYRNYSIALHLGASQKDKQWPIESFRALAAELLDRGARVALVGGRGDHLLAAEIPSHRNLENHVGLTPFPKLVELLAETDLLISADSGPVHVAAAVGTRVLALEGGSAHGWETAPYGKGNWIVQPHLINLLKRTPDKKQASASADSIGVRSLLSIIESTVHEAHTPFADPGCTVYETVEGENALALLPRAGADAGIESWYGELRGFWCRALNTDTKATNDTRNRMSKLAAECRDVALNIAETPQTRSERLVALAESLRGKQTLLSNELMQLPPLHPALRYLEISLAAAEGVTLKEQALDSARAFDNLLQGLAGLSLERSLPKLSTSNLNNAEALCAST